MKYATKREACRAWVNEFNGIPARMAFKDYDEWEFTGKLDEDEVEDYGEQYGPVDVPMWGTVWMMDDMLDEEWIDANREEVMELGFTICENYEEGWLLLGIDGAGYDFYEAHWIPLYELRGLQWHKGE